MLQLVLDLAADVELGRVVVVLGTDADELRAACMWRDEWVVINREPELGLSTSVRLGLAAISASPAERAVVLLGDQPFLSPEQLNVILAAPGQIVVPRFDGNPGNPVVLDRSVWPLASKLDGDRGFSQLFSAFPNLVTYVDVPGKNLDIDTAADLDAVSRA